MGRMWYIRFVSSSLGVGIVNIYVYLMCVINICLTNGVIDKW